MYRLPFCCEDFETSSSSSPRGIMFCPLTPCHQEFFPIVSPLNWDAGPCFFVVGVAPKGSLQVNANRSQHLLFLLLEQNCSPNLYHSVVLKDEMRRDPDLQGKDFKMFSMQENLRIDPMLVQWISLNFNVKNYYCELLDSLTLSCFGLEGSSFATGITISKMCLLESSPEINHCNDGKGAPCTTLHNMTLLSLLLLLCPALRILVVKVCWRGR